MAKKQENEVFEKHRMIPTVKRRKTMAKIKMGVFGCYRGEVMVREILGNKEAELVAVCDKWDFALDLVKKAAEEYGNNKITYYTDFDQFMNHDMDTVVLANYAHEHAPYAIRLLDSGRHVMSECLTCSSMAEAVALVEAVERSGKVYAYAENYCYTPVRWEMRERYLRGDIGELNYAEAEYLHNCAPSWPELTYGDRDHWRNMMPSTFYCTHSIGPILKMTGLRPVQVNGFETPNLPYWRALGSAAGTLGMEIITLDNGAIMKSIHYQIKNATHGSNYQLNGATGSLKDLGDGRLATYIEGNKGNGKGIFDTYTPKPLFEGTEKSGHGGSDFYPTYYFIRSILGDEVAIERSINVYEAIDMCIPGTLGYRSIVEGNTPIKIPNFRNPEEREPYRNDRMCCFPETAGDQYVSNNVKNPEPIPDEVCIEMKRRWLAGEDG